MKNKHQIWYVGYVISLFLVLAIFLADFPKMVDVALVLLFSAVFSVSYVQLLHNKMMKDDKDYKISVMDERNILIKEKAGNITLLITMILLGIATAIFISFDYLIPAIVTGTMVIVQPIILMIVSNVIEKQM